MTALLLGLAGGAALAGPVEDCVAGDAQACMELDRRYAEAPALFGDACDRGERGACLAAAYAHAGTQAWVDPVRARAASHRACQLGDTLACDQLAATTAATVTVSAAALRVDGAPVQGDLGAALAGSLGGDFGWVRVELDGPVSFERLQAALEACARAGARGYELAEGETAEVRLATLAAAPPLEDLGARGQPGAHGLVEGRLPASFVRLGGLQAGQVQQVVGRHYPAIRRCYERALNAEPALVGEVEVRFRIEPDGTPGDVHIAASELGRPEVESCLADRFREMRFPTPEGDGGLYVTLPLLFTPGG